MTHHALNAIVGCSPGIVALRELICTVAPTKLPVLIEGPTGAGKELVAAAIHEESGRRGAFVPFNVCAIGESMFEDALFGHVRGAFTGATSDSLGFLREANEGTAFFDEISGLALPLQAKMLRAIETGRFRPVGARHDVSSEFRIVAATNEEMADLVRAGRMRSDVAHRFAGVVLSVPPLADRREDIPALVNHFLTGSGRSVPKDAIDVLMAHDWPGNVRELRHAVECASALGGLSAGIVKAMLTRAAGRGIDELAVRRNALRATLVAHQWNISSVAREARVHRATVHRWIKDMRL